jgi:hypothetical protein
MGLAVVGVGLEVHANPQALALEPEPPNCPLKSLIGLAIAERSAGFSALGGIFKPAALAALESAAAAFSRVDVAKVIGHEKRPYSTSV